jgi:hypothetical protein
MDFFEASSHLTSEPLINDPTQVQHNCTPDLTDMLTVANISQGMDPLQAALDAQLQTPLIQPFLF